jgi:hypothetical protein
MRQRMFAIMAVVACAVALAGCNAEDTPPSPGPTSPGLVVRNDSDQLDADADQGIDPRRAGSALRGGGNHPVLEGHR